MIVGRILLQSTAEENNGEMEKAKSKKGIFIKLFSSNYFIHANMCGCLIFLHHTMPFSCIPWLPSLSIFLLKLCDLKCFQLVFCASSSFSKNLMWVCPIFIERAQKKGILMPHNGSVFMKKKIPKRTHAFDDNHWERHFRRIFWITFLSSTRLSSLLWEEYKRIFYACEMEGKLPRWSSNKRVLQPHLGITNKASA